MLVVQPVTQADIPTITDLWYDGFRSSGFLELIPDTPGIRQWWNDANLHDFLHKPTARYWKVVDDATPNGPPIAYAKWDMQSAEERGNRFPPWHGDMNDGCSEFFGRLERQRRELLGGTKNYCISSLFCFLFSCPLCPFPHAQIHLQDMGFICSLLYGGKIWICFARILSTVAKGRGPCWSPEAAKRRIRTASPRMSMPAAMEHHCMHDMDSKIGQSPGSRRKASKAWCGNRSRDTARCR